MVKIPEEVVAEFEADLDAQMESWTDALRERLEEVGPPKEKHNGEGDDK